MQDPFRKRFLACTTALMLIGASAGAASASSLMSASMITPPSVTGDPGVFSTVPSTPSLLPLAAHAPTCATVPPSISAPDACGPLVPLAWDASLPPAPSRLTDPFVAFDWLTSNGADTRGQGIAPAELASIVPSMPAWVADRGADPSMKLAAWRTVFNVAKLAQFAIPLRSDPAERTNIVLSARAVDGVTLQPGDVFSFNDIVGERSPERGYQDGWMFDHGQLIRGTGGGICLVATGLYNAALSAGLGLIERHPHSGIVSYAPPGCDAAVVYGSEDLKFQNTTDGPVFVRTIFQQDRVVLALFGTPPPPGFHVVVKPKTLAWLPWQTIQKPDATLAAGQAVIDQKPHSGYTVTLERVFMQGDRVVRQELLASDTHPAVNEIVRVPATPTPTDDLDTFLSNVLLGSGAA